MLRARRSDGLIILGIDAENVKRLKSGQPILVALAELGGHDDVCIMYGDTLADIQKELEDAGMRLPEPTDLKTLRKEQ